MPDLHASSTRRTGASARRLLAGLLLLTTGSLIAAAPAEDSAAARRLAQVRAAKATAAPVSDEVVTRLARGERVDVLVTLDDATEARIVAQSVGPVAHRARLDKQGYANFLQTQRMLMRNLKSDVMLAAADPDLRTLTDYENLPVVHARVDSPRALERLRRQPRVKRVDAVVAVAPTLTQSLPYIGQPTVQALGYTGAGTTVAVLDTGVDFTRPAFGSCSAPGGTCKVAYAQDFATQDYQRDSNGHGSNVAGIVLGVAPGARIAALDVFESNGLAYSNAIINAINWTISNRATYNIVAINMSLGGGRYTAPLAPGDAWGTAIGNAVAAGITVVAASGNNAYTNGISLPAAYTNVVSVGAVYDSSIGPMGWSGCSDASTAAGKVTCFSNSASFVSMLAPGAMISAAGTSMGGTSQASPHVAGAVAVIKGFAPDESPAQVTARLKLGPNVTDARNGVVKPVLDLPASLAVPPATYRLTVSFAGSGRGTIVSEPAAINCSITCAADIANGDTVTLTALHAAGSAFAGWSGACAGSGVSCTLTMSAARRAVATFASMPYEEFLAGGLLPSSWQAGAWTVSTDSRYVGSQSLRSNVVADGQSSDIRFEGRFADGTISFARRVSSESGGDELQFFIDDQLQGSWSGEVPWGMVSFPVSAGTHALLWRYVKNGSGSAGADAAWIDAVNLPLAATSLSPTRVDFDGDGRSDLIWRHGGTGANLMWLMDGGARRSGSGSLPSITNLNWRMVNAADFDGDGKADILWRDVVRGSFAVWLMDGLMQRQVVNLPTMTDLRWIVAGIGDFDGDGKADLLWRHLYTGRNRIWFMEGGSVRSAVDTLGIAEQAWRIVSVADVDGDGKSDILWRHTDGRNSLWLMDGATRQASSGALPSFPDARWQLVAAQDFDGDGKADLLWRHSATGTTTMWLMNGLTRLSVLSVPRVADVRWRIVGAGDYDGDGRADIVWRNTSTGRNSLWRMNGSSKAGEFVLPEITDLRWTLGAPRSTP